MALNLTVKVHPVVLFQIVDAYERRKAESLRVIGTLLGNVLVNDSLNGSLASTRRPDVTRRLSPTRVIPYSRYRGEGDRRSDQLLLRAAQGIREPSGGRSHIWHGPVRPESPGQRAGEHRRLVGHRQRGCVRLLNFSLLQVPLA